MKIEVCVLVALISATAAVPATAQVTEDQFRFGWILGAGQTTTIPTGVTIVGFRESGVAHLAVVEPVNPDGEPTCQEMYLRLEIVVDEPPAPIGDIADAITFPHGEPNINTNGFLTRDGRWISATVSASASTPEGAIYNVQERQLITVIPAGESIVNWRLVKGWHYFLTDAGGVISAGCGGDLGGEVYCGFECFIGYLATEAVSAGGESLGTIKGRYGSGQ